MKIAIGDRVRSFDFEGRRDCYVEGIVVGFAEVEGCERYKIEITRRVVADLEVEKRSDYCFPPINGTPTWGDRVTNFVELIAD